MKPLWSLAKEHIAIAVLAQLVVGTSLTSVAYALFSAPDKRPNLLLLELGIAFIITGITTAILASTESRVEDAVDNNFKKLERRVDSIVSRVNILSEAEECGIEKIFSCRRGNNEYADYFINELESAATGSTICFMSSSMRDFFMGPPDSNRYFGTVYKQLNNGITMNILLLDPTQPAAKRRAYVEEIKKEEPNIESKKWYTGSALFRNIRDVSENVVRLLPKYLDSGQLRVRYFDCDPTTHLVITDNKTFIEQYHQGGDDALKETMKRQLNVNHIDCYGGFVPIVVVDNSARYAQLMKSHFYNIWKASSEADLHGNNYLPEIIRFADTPSANEMV